MGGHWYSLIDGVSLNSYQCLQIELESMEMNDKHSIFNFRHGFRIKADDLAGASPFLYDDQQFWFFNASDPFPTQIGTVHNMDPLLADKDHSNQTKMILDTDYASYLIIAFCSREEGDRQTKLVSLYLKDDPSTDAVGYDQRVYYFDLMYELLKEKYGLSEEELD